MSKVYELRQNTKNYANFIEQRDKYENSFFYNNYNFKNIDLNNFKPLQLKLYASDIGKKNFQTDISKIGGCAFSFSEKAINVFKEILEQTGQIFPIETESRRKKFFGFYPNKNVYDDSIINFDKSDWRQAEKGRIINKLVLNHKYPVNDYLFNLKDEPIDCYVTDKFKDLVEKHDLKGFDFSREIAIVD